MILKRYRRLERSSSVDKHTKTIIIFFVSMLLASIVTFSVLYLMPLVTSGNSPPHQALCTKKTGAF